MKQLMITLLLACTTFLGLASDNEKNIPAIIIATFQRDFPDAEGVKWEQVENFTVASFISADKNLSAYYYDDGTIAVVAETISRTTLPRSLRNHLDAKAPTGSLLAVYKMMTDTEIKYYCEMLVDGQKQILESIGSKWYVTPRKK